MKTRLLMLLVPVALATTPAFAAGDKAACLDASSKAQTLRDEHKLLEAREQLRACAAARCPSVVQTDCATWLTEVEKALPSVVLSAKDGAGADLSDVTVTVDGQPLASRLDGQSFATNPGSHTFHFQRADGTSLDRRVIVSEGAKNQAVSVVLGPVAAAPPPQPAPDTTQASAAPPAASAQGSSSSMKTAGWVIGGVGVVGLGVGIVAGLIAMGDKSSADCNASNQCLSGPLSSAKSTALVSDIGFIAGSLLLAGGVTLVLVAPRGSETQDRSTASLKLAPMIGASGGGVVLGGSW